VKREEMASRYEPPGVSLRAIREELAAIVGVQAIAQNYLGSLPEKSLGRKKAQKAQRGNAATENGE
jgi:hypothetical protein